jgi:hypothetical protein
MASNSGPEYGEMLGGVQSCAIANVVAQEVATTNAKANIFLGKKTTGELPLHCKSSFWTPREICG